jgi:hypothetical protein
MKYKGFALSGVGLVFTACLHTFYRFIIIISFPFSSAKFLLEFSAAFISKLMMPVRPFVVLHICPRWHKSNDTYWCLNIHVCLDNHRHVYVFDSPSLWNFPTDSVLGVLIICMCDWLRVTVRTVSSLGRTRSATLTLFGHQIRPSDIRWWWWCETHRPYNWS